MIDLDANLYKTMMYVPEMDDDLQEFKPQEAEVRYEIGVMIYQLLDKNFCQINSYNVFLNFLGKQQNEWTSYFINSIFTHIENKYDIIFFKKNFDFDLVSQNDALKFIKFYFFEAYIIIAHVMKIAQISETNNKYKISRVFNSKWDEISDELLIYINTSEYNQYMKFFFSTITKNKFIQFAISIIEKSDNIIRIKLENYEV